MDKKVFKGFALTTLELGYSIDDFNLNDICSGSFQVSNFSEKEIIGFIKKHNMQILDIFDENKADFRPKGLLICWCLILNYRVALKLLLSASELVRLGLDSDIYSSKDCTNIVYSRIAETQVHLYFANVFQFEFATTICKENDIESFRLLLGNFQSNLEWAKISEQYFSVEGFTKRFERAYNENLLRVMGLLITKVDKFSNSVVSSVFSELDIASIKFLELCGLDLNLYLTFDKSIRQYPLFVNIYGNAKLVAHLLSVGLDINYTDEFNRNVLDYSYSLNCVGLKKVDFILSSGLNLNTESVSNSILRYITKNSVDYLKLFLSYGYEIPKYIGDKPFITVFLEHYFFELADKVASAEYANYDDEAQLEYSKFKINIIANLKYLLDGSIDMSTFSTVENEDIVKLLYVNIFGGGYNLGDTLFVDTLELLITSGLNIDITINVDGEECSFFERAVYESDFALINLLLKEDIGVANKLVAMGLDIDKKEAVECSCIDLFYKNVSKLNVFLASGIFHCTNNGMYKQLEYILADIHKSTSESALFYVCTKDGLSNCFDYMTDNFKLQYVKPLSGENYEHPLLATISESFVKKMIEIGLLNIDTGIPLPNEILELKDLDIESQVLGVVNYNLNSTPGDIPF